MTDPAVLEHWNRRASLGERAGTRDRILKQLELRFLRGCVQDGMRLLDAGCGTGETAIAMAKQNLVTIDAFDLSPSMVNVAQETVQAAHLEHQITVREGDVLHLPAPADFYDLVYTERCLINLPCWPVQADAIRALQQHVRPGGQLLLIESCQDGLDDLNALRAVVGLPAIVPPWHNRYLVSSEIETMRMNEEIDFTSTYYLLSRVINAAVSANRCEQPDYDSPINQLALLLPSHFGGCGQTRVWIWRKFDG